MGTVEELIATLQRERSTEAQVISEATVRAHDLVTEIGRNLELAAAGRPGCAAERAPPAGPRAGRGNPRPVITGVGTRKSPKPRPSARSGGSR